VALYPTYLLSKLELLVYRKNVMIGSHDTHELWHRAGLLCFLRLTSGAISILNVIGIADLSSSLPVVRCFMRSFWQLILCTEIGQYDIIGRLDKLCPVGSKRYLIAHFADR
jgi:hypothetical protein